MVTGGEPLLQEPVFALMENLCDTGYEVVLETSGSVDISHVDPRVHRIVDVKCPGSGMQDACRIQDIPLLTDRDEVKFVIRDRTDYEYAREFIATHSIHDRCTVLMSPVFGELPNVRLAEWILEDGLPVRYQVQLHKYIWEPQTRGV
jgi:7-carboxy-7-deazaguanine synthase